MSFKPYSKIIIRDANLVNEGKQEFVDVLIQDGRIEKIAPSISHVVNAKTIHANGNWLIPGMIDDQVHFRDPGSPHKGSSFGIYGSSHWRNYQLYGYAKHQSPNNIFRCLYAKKTNCRPI